MTTLEVLKQCSVDGNIVKLPSVQLDKKEYADIKTKLENIGGKWKGGKIFGFVFESDPTELLAGIAGGKVRNIKKEFQFFATPDELADRLVKLAKLEYEHEVLEPSAGDGVIVKAIHRVYPNKLVWCYELMPANQQKLNKIENAILIGGDFLEECDAHYDRIIANPPFSKNQDIAHIQHMYIYLNPLGRLVSISSLHWKYASGKKEIAFRKWLDDLGAKVIDIPAGEFKQSGTTVASCIIIIDKPRLPC